MEKEQFKGYYLEDLLGDQQFIDQILKIQTKQEWEDFLNANESAGKEIIRAREIIHVLKVNEGKLREDLKFSIWKNISDFDKMVSKEQKIVRMNFFIRVAASVLVILTLGGIIYWQYNIKSENFVFSKIEATRGNNPVLLLANNKKVELASGRESSIVVLKNQEAILVNNDLLIQNSASSQVSSNTLNEITVPYGKKVTLQLSDGSKVHLNAGSSLAFPQSFTGKTREVRLAGEGYFEVAKNANQPFIVSTSKVYVKVLGTKFNVSDYVTDNISETVLLEGKVEIHGKGKLFNDQLVLAPNQKAEYWADEKQLTKSDVPDAGIYTTWTNGWYNFANEKLERVFAKLERYYNVRFTFDQSSIGKALPVSGKLDLKESIGEVMESLAGVAKIDYNILNDNIVINIRDH